MNTKMTATYRWLILIRACRDNIPNSGTAELGLAWRVSDRYGILPNRDEEDTLKAQASAQFHARFGVNPSRVVVTQVPYFPADGDLVSWRDFDLAGGGDY
jgi:hypothetical protein